MVRPPSLRLLFIALVCVSSWACGDRRQGSSVSRDTFVQTYVALRVAALQTESGDLPDSARTRILAERGVTERDLLAFVEARGADFDFMRDLWNEIEQKMDSVSLDGGVDR